jgi:hypothetical protein
MLYLFFITDSTNTTTTRRLILMLGQVVYNFAEIVAKYKDYKDK